MMKSYAVGVDVGGTSVKLGLFSVTGNLLEQWEIPTRTENGGENILPDIAGTIRDKLSERGVTPDAVEGIGIGVPGPVDDSFTVHKCVNLGWGVLNLKEEMNRLLPEIPRVAAGNDANVAALGELWRGGGKGRRSAVMVTLGTGVGGGVVIDGKIVAGTNGGAGEIGHMTVDRSEGTFFCATLSFSSKPAQKNASARMAHNPAASRINTTRCNPRRSFRSNASSRTAKVSPSTVTPKLLLRIPQPTPTSAAPQAR